MLQWLRNLFQERQTPAPPPLRRRPKPSYACTDHVEDDPPPYCHYCWDKAKKPTLFKPDHGRYDKRLCWDWICEDCVERRRAAAELRVKKYNNTSEAAALVFTEENGVFKCYDEPIEADFPLSYESLAPYVTRVLDIADGLLDHGIEFDGAIIHEGEVSHRKIPPHAYE